MDYDTHLDRLACIVTLEPSKSLFGTRKPSYPTPLSSSPLSSSPTSSIIPLATSSVAKSYKNPRWKPTRQVLNQFVSPVIRRLLAKFDQHDNCSKRELRLTLLIAHHFDEKGQWKGNSRISDTTASSSSRDSQNQSVSTDSATSSSKTDTEKLEAEFFDIYDLWIFGEYLPEIPAPPINVDVIQAERHNPTVKHVDWATERKKIEKEGCVGSNEMLLMDIHGNIYEGLSSNFVAIVKSPNQSTTASHDASSLPSTSSSALSNGSQIEPVEGIFNHEYEEGGSAHDSTIMTAPDSKVLSGTIRSLMIQCIQESGLHIKYECPQIKDLLAGKWEACAVMSTSRLLLPISTIIVLRDSKAVKKPEANASGAASEMSGGREKTSASASSSIVASSCGDSDLKKSSEVFSGVKIEILPESPRILPTGQNNRNQQNLDAKNVEQQVEDIYSTRPVSPEVRLAYPTNEGSQHVITSVHTFKPNHPTITFLQHQIARKMLLSATSLVLPVDQ